MNIGVIGATGKAGQLIVREAIDQGLTVTALVRSPEKMKVNVPVVNKDALELTTNDLNSYDLVVNAVGLPPEKANKISKIGEHLIRQILPLKNQTRFITMGHAGTLYQSEERKDRVYESDTFPDEFKATVINHLKNLKALKATEGLNWTFVCPAAYFDPNGQESGDFTIGKEVRIKNKQGKSYVSYPDYAQALVREILQEKYMNQQINVVGEKIK